MNTINFIQSVNLNLPTLAQVISKYKRRNPEFSEHQAEEYLEKKKLIVNENSHPFSDDIEFLIHNTNISSVGIGGINFRQNIKVVASNVYQFASYNDYYWICYDKPDSRIICITEDTDTLDLISPSVSQFLSFLYIYYRYDVRLIFGYEFPQNELKAELNVLIKNGLSENWVKELIGDWPW